MARFRLTVFIFALTIFSPFVNNARAEILTYEISGLIAGYRDPGDVYPFYVVAGLPYIFPFSARLEIDANTPSLPNLVIPGRVEEFLYPGAVSSAELRMGNFLFRSDRIPSIDESGLRVRYDPPQPSDVWHLIQGGLWDESIPFSPATGIPSNPLFTPVDVDISGIDPELAKAGWTAIRVRILEVGFKIASPDYFLTSSRIPGDEIAGLHEAGRGNEVSFWFESSLSVVRPGTGEEVVINDNARFITGRFDLSAVSAVPEPAASLSILVGLTILGTWITRRRMMSARYES